MNKSFKKLTISLCLAFLTLLIMGSYSTCDVQAATKTRVTSVSNSLTGIKVKWRMDSKKTGYAIYRRAGNSKSYKRVETIDVNNINEWIDQDVNNGTRYYYRVYPMKGTKVYKNTISKKTYRMETPVATVTSEEPGKIRIMAEENERASGFKIYYSKDSTFATYKAKYVYKTTLDTTISSLPEHSKYYIRVKAFKTKSGVKYYSGYTGRIVEVMGTTMTDTPIVLPDPDGPANGQNKYQAAILERAFDILNSKTKYVGGQTGDVNADGAMMFDCIGFVRRVHLDALGYCYNSTGTSKMKFVDSRQTDKYYKVGWLPGTCPDAFNPSPRSYTILDGSEAIPVNVKIVKTRTIDESKMQPGDVMFFCLWDDRNKENPAPGHVGIYVGNSQFIHCTGPEGKVVMSSFASSTSEYRKKFLGYGNYYPQ